MANQETLENQAPNTRTTSTPGTPISMRGRTATTSTPKRTEMGCGFPCTLAKAISQRGRQRITIEFDALI